MHDLVGNPFVVNHPSGYYISTDSAQLNETLIHQFLSEETHWARHIPLATVRRSLAHSLNFGLYAADGQQAGFARVVTDYTTFAWLCDVFVLPAHRGQGLSKFLVETMLAHPDLQGVRQHLLATSDAHGLYHPFGYEALGQPERWLERKVLNPYG